MFMGSPSDFEMACPGGELHNNSSSYLSAFPSPDCRLVIPKAHFTYSGALGGNNLSPVAFATCGTRLFMLLESIFGFGSLLVRSQP
jgi:hypothetical protein